MIPLLADLAGTWRLEVAVSTRTRLPVFGHTRSVSLDLARVEVGTDGRVQQVGCDSRILDKGFIARSVLPEAFIRALPPVEYHVELDAAGRFRADMGAQAVGYDPRYPFPSRTTDPGVFDWDKDGKPAATVLIEVPILGAGEVYVAQLGQMVLEGRVSSPDLVEGGVQMPILQARTLGASVRLLDTTPEFEVEPARSWFQLARVPEGSTCAQISASWPLGDGDRPGSPRVVGRAAGGAVD